MTPAIILISAVFFCAMILNLAAKPKCTRGLIGAITFISAVGGLFFYGYGYSCTLNDPVQMVVRTAFAVSRMYAGVNDLGSISAAPLLQYPAAVTVFWVLHLMAFYATASATISALGSAALKRLKYWLQRYGDSVIIFGISGDSLEFGRSLVAEGARNIIFVGDKPDAAYETAVNSMGALLRSDVSALKPDLKFLKSLGSEKGCPKLTVYTLDADENQNQVYARALLNAMEAAGVDTGKTRLVMRSSDDSVETGLSRTPERYGYDDVHSFTDVSVTGRLLMQVMPPCEKMNFRPDGTADGDFDAIIVGFGRTGRSVLRYLVRNAQFAGSHFRTAVFSTTAENENGYFYASYPGIPEHYDVNFRPEDARSVAFYEYLRSVSESLRYVVICTGNQSRDAEIRAEVAAYLTNLHCDAAVCRCSVKAVAWSTSPAAPIQYRSAYSADLIGSEVSDRMAMVLNHSYVNDKSISVKAAWDSCDYFSRESSRASADFIRAFLRITGTAEEQALSGAWDDLSPELLENLGRTEHLRWCAFHYSMGFTAMDTQTLRARGEAWREQIRQTGKSNIRLGRDLTSRKHACLCSWEELDALAALEAEYTGTVKDYKEMDIRNVLAMPEVLRAAKEHRQ